MQVAHSPMFRRLVLGGAFLAATLFALLPDIPPVVAAETPVAVPAPSSARAAADAAEFASQAAEDAANRAREVANEARDRAREAKAEARAAEREASRNGTRSEPQKDVEHKAIYLTMFESVRLGAVGATELVKAGGWKPLEAAVVPIRQTCGACHRQFRLDDDEKPGRGKGH